MASTQGSAFSDQRSVAITGAAGFVGAQLVDRFGAARWSVTRFTRAPSRGADGAVPFELGEELNPEVFRARRISALVHCAYDFQSITWSDIHRINVEGSRKLLAAAKDGGVGRIVLLSTISAFTGCRSLYGRAKLEIEAAAAAVGALVLRPGLVYGEEQGAGAGMFGSLTQSVRGRVVPLVDGGTHPQYLVHVDDLFELIGRFCDGDLENPGKPVVVASPRPWPMRELLTALARRHGREPTFVSVPWQAVWAGLKMSEMARLHIGYRSDSVVSLVHQDPHPDFTSLSAMGITVRDFNGA